tara:strand:+ start:112 stop:285 length:174 start_codon:yes stop_codon:yes gene_type:complete
MNTDLFKSIALNMDTYKKLREMADKKFEMPQSLAKTASYFIIKAYENYKENGNKSPK